MTCCQDGVSRNSGSCGARLSQHTGGSLERSRRWHQYSLACAREKLDEVAEVKEEVEKTAHPHSRTDTSSKTWSTGCGDVGEVTLDDHSVPALRRHRDSIGGQTSCATSPAFGSLGLGHRLGTLRNKAHILRSGVPDPRGSPAQKPRAQSTRTSHEDDITVHP